MGRGEDMFAGKLLGNRERYERQVGGAQSRAVRGESERRGC